MLRFMPGVLPQLNSPFASSSDDMSDGSESAQVPPGVVVIPSSPPIIPHWFYHGVLPSLGSCVAPALCSGAGGGFVTHSLRN